MDYHGITKEMEKEFCRDYLGTLHAIGKSNVFRSPKSIAQIMGIPVIKVIDFIVVSEKNGFMYEDNNPTPNYVHFPTLFKVWEEHLES